MSEFKKTIEVRLFAALRGAAKDVTDRAGRAVGAVVLDLWRKRLSAGIGPDGKPFRELSRSYLAYKKAFVLGVSRKRKGKKGGRKFPRKGEFAAEKVPDFGALTGRLKRSATVRMVKTRNTTHNSREVIIGEVRVDVNSYGEKLLRYHQVDGVGKRKVKRRYAPGLADPATSIRNKEDRELLRVYKGALRVALNSQGIVTQEQKT